MDVKLDSLQNVLLVLTCLVPGFILHSTYSLFSKRRSEAKELLFLRFVTFTALNLLVCLPWVRLVLGPHFIQLHPWRTVRYFLGIIFVSPLILGLTVSLLDHAQLLPRFGRLFGLKAMHSIPTAWDYYFSKIGQSGPRFVIVTFKDGKVVGGLFLHPALASSDSAERDIYLIETYSNATGEWVRQPQNDGILIMAGEIRSLEFLHPEVVPNSRMQMFARRTRYICKAMRVRAEKRLRLIRQTGNIARWMRDTGRKAKAVNQAFIARIDAHLEEEKNGIRIERQTGDGIGEGGTAGDTERGA